MVATLPRNIALKLEQTLAQWRSWRGESAPNERPRVIRRLSPGLSNYSILVAAGSQFVVRIDGLNPAVNGLSRQTEWSVLQSASAQDLAPAPRYYNPDLGSLVLDYLEADQSQEHTHAATAQLMRDIHRLPAVHFRLDLGERIRRYRKHIEHRGRKLHTGLAACGDSVLALVAETAAEVADLVLCHNDLLQANRLTCGGQLRAIDWEYCAMGNRWFDLAVVSVGDEMSSDESREFVSSYLGREPGTNELRDFTHYQVIYRYLELLWFSALDDATERQRQLSDSRLESLTGSLSALNP